MARKCNRIIKCTRRKRYNTTISYKSINEYSKTVLSDNKISFATSRTSSSRLVILEKDIVEASEKIAEAVIIRNDNDNNDDDDSESTHH